MRRTAGTYEPDEPADPQAGAASAESDAHIVVAGAPGSAPIVLRRMAPADIEGGLCLCRASGWNQVARDWQHFLAVNPNGARVLDKGGEVVGTVTSLRYGPFGWLAMVLVAPAERGRGLGSRLLDAGLELLSDLASTRLDATPAGEGLYRTRGFTQEFRLLRMARPSTTDRTCTPSARARRMEPQDLAAVAEWDIAAFGGDRRAVLEWLYEGAPEYAWIMEASGRPTGYLLGRHGFAHHHLGPVVAQDAQTALQILRTCLASHTGRSFIVDASEHSPDWVRGLQALGFVPQRPFLRMALGLDRFGSLGHVFASAGPELG